MTAPTNQQVDTRPRIVDGLRDLLAVVNSSQSTSEILSYLVRKADEVLEADGAAVYLLDPSDPTVPRVHASHGMVENLLAEAPVGVSVSGLSASLRRPVVIASLADLLARDVAPSIEEQYEDRGLYIELTRPGAVTRDDAEHRPRRDDIATTHATLLAVPLTAHDTTYGALELFYRNQLSISFEHIDVGLAFAQLGAVALENARLREQADRRSSEIGRRQRLAEGLRDLLAVINSNHDIETILAELLTQASRLLGNDAGVVYLKQSDTDQLLHIKASMGLGRDQLAEQVRIGSPTTGLAVQQARALVCWDLREALGDQTLRASDTQLEDFGSYARIVRLGSRTDPDLEQGLAQPRVHRLIDDFRAVVSAPLVARGHTLGAITLFHDRPHHFTIEEVELVNAFAQQASLAIENARLHAESEQRMRENERRRRVAEGVRDLLAVVNSSRPLDEILDHVLEQASDLLGSDAGSVLLLDSSLEHDGVLTVRASRALASEIRPVRLPVGTAMTGVAVERRSPVAVCDLVKAAPERGRSRPELRDRGGFIEILRIADPGEVVSDGFSRVLALARHYRALLAVPLVSRGEVIGAITLYYRDPREFGREDVALAESFADQTALAMENARLHERAVQRSRDLEALYRADEELYRSLHLDQVLEALVDVGSEVLQADMTSVLIWDERREHLIPGATRGFAPETVQRMSHARDDGITALVAATGKPAAVEDAANDPRVAHRITDPEGIRSLLHVPIIVNGEVFGVFGVNYRQQRTLAGEEERVLLALAHRAAVAIENAQLYAQSEQRLDELSALYRADEVLHRSLRLDDVLRALVEVATEVLHAERTSVQLWDNQRQEFVLAATHGSAERSTGPENAQSATVAAISIGGQVFGQFEVAFGSGREPSQQNQRLVQALAQRAAVAIQNARLFERAQQVATTEERERLARELHDAVTQTLFSASLIAEVVPRLLDRNPTEGRRRVDELRRLTRGALSEMRTLLLELRPAALMETPLNQLLTQLGETAASRDNLDISVRVDGDAWSLPADVHIALYRIAQEALNNTLKHAAATSVRIHLRWRADGVDMRIKDDGRGFLRSTSSHGRLGLGILDERAQAIGATLRLRSRPAHGTSVDVHWRRSAT